MRVEIGGGFCPAAPMSFLRSTSSARAPNPSRFSRILHQRLRRVSGIDQSPNGLAMVPGEWHVRSAGTKNRFPAGAPIKNVHREASSLVARGFFARAAFSSVREILDGIQRRGGR